MMHLLLHASGATVSKTLRLLQLHDIALLSSRMTPADWDSMLSQPAERRPWWALPPLLLMLRYYPSTVPARVIDVLRDDCPRRLARIFERRVLSDVSHSYLWVDAFPGIEWAQSIRERICFAIERVRPRADDAALRNVFLRAQTWAAEDPWRTLSQSRRVLRWITSRPTRPAAVHAVRAALALGFEEPAAPPHQGPVF
jgi:hypothetical protein